MFPEIHRKLNFIINQLGNLDRRLHRMETNMALDFAALEAELQHETDAETAVENLLTQLVGEIKNLASQAQDPADQQKLNDLAARFSANTDKLSAAVTANTPAA